MGWMGEGGVDGGGVSLMEWGWGKGGEEIGEGEGGTILR